MANKKDWREEYKEKNPQEESEKSNWRDKYKEYYDYNSAKIVGEKVTSMLEDWQKNYNSYVTDYTNRFSKRKGSYEDAYVGDSLEWLNAETEKRSALKKQEDDILAYLNQYGGHLDSKWVKQVFDTIEQAKDAQYKIHTGATQDNEYWNSFGSEELLGKYGSAQGAYEYYQRADDYSKKYSGLSSEDLKWAAGFLEDGEEKEWMNSYISQKDYAEKSEYDIAAGESEIKEMEDYALWVINELKPYSGYHTEYQKRAEELFGKYGVSNAQEMKDLIEEKKRYIADSTRIQNNIAMSSVSDPTSKYYDPSFKNYTDTSNIALLDIMKNFGGYKYMNSKERDTFAYHYNKYGAEKANEYLDSIAETLNYRKAERNFAKYKDQVFLEEVFAIEAGLDQAYTGLKNLFSDKDYIPTSSKQYLSGMIREDLKDDGFKLPDWMGGASGGQIVYDLLNTSANMAPSMLVGAAANVVVPGSGALVGAAMMGGSTAGNAYQEALNLGYDKGQARMYSTLVGASEAGLQYLMGGIGKLGGKLSGKAATTLASKFNNAYARLAVQYGTNMLSEGAEEYLQEVLTPVFKNLAFGTDEEIELITEEAIYSFLLGALTSGMGEITGITSNTGKSLPGHLIEMSALNKKNKQAAEMYGDATADLVKEGLESDSESEAHELAEMFKRKLDKGKKMSGYEIRQQIAANDDIARINNKLDATHEAAKRLKELGETSDIGKIASLVAKNAMGQKLTRDETSTLVRSKYGAQVAKEMRDSVAQEEKATYKPLEERVEAKTPVKVSDTGKTVVRATDDEIDPKSIKVKEISEDSVVLDVNGKDVDISDVDFATEELGNAFNALKKVEHITPTVASDMIAKIDTSKPIWGQMNGMDEAFTYGYYGYSEADRNAGLFTGHLTKEQLNDAYKLGQYVKSHNESAKSDAIKKMRTALESETERAKSEGKEAPKAKKMTITYNAGNGKVVSFDKAGFALKPKQKAAPALAKIFHEMGLGTNFEFYASYKKKGVRVYLDDYGVERNAPSGVYRKADGTIRIDLNAYDGKGLTLDVMAHELTHFIQQWSTEKYEVLADFLVNTYDKTDMSMHKRVIREQSRLERIRGQKVSYNEAYDEVVANAMSKMLSDGNVMERLYELKARDMDLVQKLWKKLKEFINEFLGISEKLFYDATDLEGMKEDFEQLKNLWAEAFVEASENFQANLMAIEVGVEPVAVEDITMYSYSSLAEAAGFTAVENKDGTRSFTRDGKKVSEVTVTDIDNSPIGAFINFSAEMGDISDADAMRQKQMFADICTMASKTNDFAMTMQFVGSAVFTGMKANADKQYGTTYDFPSICTKTQAVIDAMSAKMVKLGRGLNTNEIVQLYDDVFASGNPVPCPECYVFSRWIGIGGLLDNIKKYQDYYGDMEVKDVADAYLKMKAEVSKFADEQGISFGKAKGALTSKLTKEYNKLNEKIEKAQNQGEKVKPADQKRLAELEPMMNTVKSMTWLENVYFADSSLKKVNPNFRVPDSVLFDLNNGEAFATKYKDAWAFRTTQGAGYGKAITPYAEARLGEGVLVTNNTTNAIKGRAQGTLDNFFLQQMGKLDKKSRDALKRARLKQKIQAFIGGQRFQSTSDARYENASDYLLAALEMQAMGGMVQAYTKVDGAVPAFSAWGFSINQSLMPLNGGLDADGNVKDTAVGGMKPEVAFANRNKYESAGTITIGVNDNHIRAMFKQLVRDFIIPYHASGGKADVVAEFRRIQEGKEAKGKAVRSTDYSRTQSDKILSDEVLRWQGKTDAQIQRIHEIRDTRIAILTGGKVNMTVVRSNRFLSALYDKLNGGEWDGVKLAKSKVESQIFPNEFWDQTINYDESGKITKDYLEYCEDLGFLHRFSGMVPSNGKLVPVNGYNENGERVQLTDLAYQYDENGNKTDNVEDFFWKVLTDRRMYDNNGKYLAQKVVTLNDTTTETVTGFAKNNQGREYDKAKAEALAKKIVGEQYSSQETDADAKDGPYSYNTLINKPDMVVTTVDGNVPKNRADIVHQAKQNAAKVGAIDPKTGSVSVHVDDVGTDVLLGTEGLKHGLRRTKDAQNDANYIVTLKAGEIIKNSIKINETNPKKQNATGSYVLIGAATNTSGDLYIVRSVVNQFKNELAAMDVLYAINAKKELAATKSPRSMAKPLSETSSTISIAELLDLVNQYFPDVLPEDVLKHYGYDARPEGDLGEGMLYSSQETDADYIRYDRTAILKESKVDEYLNDYAAWSAPKYAQAYITYMRPRDFLKLTTTGIVERFHIDEQAGKLDEERLSDSRPGIYLRIDHKTGKVVGHEGRHRMSAMGYAGVDRVPVLLVDESNNMTKTDIDRLYLHGQFDETEMSVVMDAIPLSVENRSRVIEKFATQSANQRIGEKIGYNKTLRFSEHDTDYSNRSLLANAFEGITRDSIEYKMIQEYKSHIKDLNALDKELGKINAEIREIRFTKGKYDAKKLSALESKATAIANEITRHDRELLSLEASEPLRKVLQRERKKEAQKTKEHIAEIQQNKKVRAEQTELRHKIRKTIRDLDKILNRGNKKQNVKEDMKGFASKALELADYLFTDHISNDDLIRKGITVRMTPKEAALVKETEDILSKLYDHADSLTDEEFTQLDAKRKANEDKLRDLLTTQRNERLNTPVYNLFNDLVTEYAKLKNSNQDAVKAAYNPEVERFLRSYIGEANGETDSDRKTLLQNMRVADMTTDELWKLHNAYKMVLHSVRTANELFVKGKTETLEQKASRIIGDFANRKIPDKKVAIVARNIANKIGWDYEKLYYALDRIGSEAFTELVMNIANSENIVMQDIMEAVAFRDEMIKKYGFNNWAVNKKLDREFLDNTGKKFKLTMGELMSLYAYSRRENAWDHIEYGGFAFGKTELTDPKPADTYKLTKEQCEAMFTLLTKEQKGYAEDMQKYLSEVMGGKGNEVSMLLYGIKMFGENNYFPLHVYGAFKAQADEAQAKAAEGFTSMSNAGFTHARTPNAKAPIVLDGFNEVWADHVNEMSRYHGTVPALEDMRRVMNRSFYSESGMESMAIKQLMINNFGEEAVKYFDNLYREANSGAITDKLEQKHKKLLSLFRKNSVAYSLSVVIQQPSAMSRAYAMIDKKYFGFKGVGALASGVAKAVSSKWNPAYANAYNEMKKYAPGVTMAKEIGGFDTHTGSSIREYLLDTGKSFKQSMQTENLKGKAKAALDLVDNNAIANLPAVTDKIAWIEIWNACKRETLAKHRDLASNSEEFMQAVGERFTEVIRATQVYDSMFSKSPMLKSKNLAVQYLVSFMNEPNTTANMVEKAVRDATKGDWKSGVRTAVAVTSSIIFNNVLKAVIYAMRDDDEDETYIEKYAEAVVSGMIADFNPLSYIPYVRDVVSKLQGYDVERPDMAIVTDAIEAYQAIVKIANKDTENLTEQQLAELDKKVTDASWKLVGSVAAFFGIPVKNIYREIDGIIDHVRIASANAGMTTPSSVWDKVTASIPFLESETAKADKLYEAILSGDKAYIDRLKAGYVDKDGNFSQSKYDSAVVKALRENDPRIKAAAQANVNSNAGERNRILNEIKAEGKFSASYIIDAINAETSAIRNKGKPDKVAGQYEAYDFVEAVSAGDANTAKAVREDIISTYVANGKTQTEAEKAFVSDVKTGIEEAYSYGDISKDVAKDMLIDYANMDEEDAADKITIWDFLNANPDSDLSESKTLGYLEFAEPAHVSLEVYEQFINDTADLKDIKDKWGDVEVTTREQVLEVIDSLPLSWQQKDALYLAYGYKESTIWDVPW